MPKNPGKHVTTNTLKLNAQWLKNAARTLGMNGISTIADISPNLAKTGQVAASSITTVTSAANSVRRQQRPIQYLLESNKYVKLGKQAINNALSDLAHGKFSNQDRSSGNDEMGGTSTGTYFGDMSDGSDADASVEQPTVQNIYNTDTKAIEGVSNAVTTQTKYQLEMGKANIDTMVAIASSSMTQQQKNSDAILAQVTEMNRGVQALVAYNNENMTKFISAAMTYYEAAGKSLGVGKEETAVSTTRSIINDNGGLDVDAYRDRVKKQFSEQLRGSTAGMVLQMIADAADDFVANPLEFVSKAVMDKAIPEVTKKAMKATDKVFGSFMTEMLLQVGDEWGADESDTLIGKAKRFAANVFGIVDRRKTKIDRSGKISSEAAVFDGVTRAAIIDELPKYARESTSYLRSIVQLLGGDPNNALRGSRILNRETGRYQSMESFATDFASSIDNKVVAAMDSTTFGKEMRNMASRVGKSDEQLKKLNEAIDKFFVAAEKNSKGAIDLHNLGEGSEMAELIKDAGLDPNMQTFIKETIAGMARNQTGLESFNEGRNKARRNRNLRIDEISGDTGMLRTSNLFHSGSAEEEIDVSNVTAESLLPQKMKESGIKLPGARVQSIGDSVADALYGNGTARLLGGANPRSMAVGSVGARLKTIEDILLRGVNVRIDNNPPWQGADGIGGSFSTGFNSGNATGQDNGIVLPPGVQRETTAVPSSSSDASKDDDIDLSNIKDIADEEMGQIPPPATGRGSKVANSLAHARRAMYLMMTGNASLAMNEMSTMLGETMSGVAGAAKKHILDPLRDAILPTKEVTDENGNTHTEKVTVLEMVKEKFSSVTNSVKETLLGKDENGNAKSISTFFKEGMEEWKKTIFGDKDPEEVKAEIQKRVPDAVGGAAAGSLVGLLVGGPLTGAIIGGAAGFAKRSEWFQDMIFGKVDEDGTEIKKGLIPPSVKKYYDENKTSLTTGAAVGGVLGMVVGGPVLGAAAGIGATILKKSDKFNELLFGKEETDEKTGMTKKVGGVLNLFKEVTSHYAKGTSDDMKGLSAKAAIGAGGGLLLSMFTPIGPVGGAALGLAASVASNGDKLKQFLFGKENEDGTKEAGLFQKMGNDITAHVINPLRDGVLDFFDKSKDKVIDKMLSPMLAALQPLLNFGGRIYEKTLGKIAAGAQVAGDLFTGFLRKTAKKIYDKTLGKAGGFVKKAAGAAVSVATGVVGRGFKHVGNWAEKKNRRASLKRFNKEKHDKQLQAWEEEYNNDPNAQENYSLEEYLEEKKSRYYYNYGDKLKNVFGTDEERKAARAETKKRIKNRKELRKQSLLINELTGGKFSDTGATAKQAALDAYMQSKRYEKGKGLSIKHYGKLSQEDILKMLTVDKSENSAISSAQAMIMDQQLESQKEAAGKLGQIYDWLENVGRKITGADNPERQEKRAQRQEARATRKTEKQERREAARAEEARRDEELEKRLESGKDGSKEAKHLQYQDKQNNYQSEKWKEAEREIKKGLHSRNATIRLAAQDAYTAFFDDDDERIIGNSIPEILSINKAKKKAWELFQDNVKSTKKPKKERTKIGTLGALRSYKHTKAFNRSMEENSLPHRANGGPIDEGLAVVGERGPEVVQFPGKARVLSGQSKIDVNVVGMAPDVLKAVGSETAVQDVRIVGQNGLLATYGTSAKLGSKTNNSGKIEDSLEDENKLIRYDDVKQDNDDYEEQEEKTPSLLEKILGLFNGEGGILSKLGLIAGGAGLIALLSNKNFRDLIADIVGGAAKDLNDGIESGVNDSHSVTDPTTGEKKQVVDAETHAEKKENGALRSSIHDQLGTVPGLLASGKDLLITRGASKVVSAAGRAAFSTAAAGGSFVGGTTRALNFVPKVIQSAGVALAERKAGEAVGLRGLGRAFSTAMSSSTGVDALNTVSRGAGKFTAIAAKGSGYFKSMGSFGAQLSGAAATIGADIGWNAAETSKHSTMSGDYGFGVNAGGYRAESSTAKTFTSGGLGLAATMAAAGIVHAWHPGGWVMLIVAGISAIISYFIAKVVNNLVGWIQDKSDREYSIRSNSTKLNLVTTNGITYDDSAMNPRYVYCAQESDRVLGLDEGVFVGEADVCMAGFLYAIKENLTTSPGAEVLLYDLINNMAVQGVPFACSLAGSSNICNASGDQANSDFGEPIITSEGGFLKGAKTQVTQTRVNKYIDEVMGDVATNVARNAGSDHQFNLDDVKAVYEAGKKVNEALTRAGILQDGKSVNTKLFKGDPGSGRSDGGWKSLEKITRENGSYFLAKCIVYINSKVEVEGGKQWVELKKDQLEMLMQNLSDFLEKESGMSSEEMQSEFGMTKEEADAIASAREERESGEIDSAGTLAESTGAITSEKEQVYDSVNKQEGIKAKDKADISKELRFLTAAWAYAHPAELQRWVQEHPDESGVPKNFQNLIASWNDPSVISDKNTRKELRREMVNASLQYAKNHGDIFGWLPLVKWDDSYSADDFGHGTYGVYSETGWNMDAQQYGPGYIFRGTEKEGEGTLQQLFSDAQLGYDKTPEDMHTILFGDKDENEGSEGNDPTKVEASNFWGKQMGIIGGIASRVARHASDTAEAMYVDKSENLSDNILAGIPSNAPPYVDSEDNLVEQDKAATGFDSIVKGIIDAASAIGSAAKTGADAGSTAVEATGGGKGGRGNVIPFYSQKDPRWAGRPYDQNNTETMADAGCGPTALSMAVNGAGGAGPSPTDAADRLKALGARDNTGTSWTGMEKGIDSYGLKSDQTSNPGEGFVDSGINSGDPVILSGSSMDEDDPFTSQGHYVVVAGKDRDGNYVVNDPNKSAPVSYTKEQVTRNAAKGWKVSGGRGKYPVIRGGGRAVAAETAMMGGSSTKKNEIEETKNKWISIIKAVKQAIANQQPGYNQSNWIDITIGGKTLKVRTDCSGFVTACLKYMGEVSDSQNFTSYNFDNPSDPTLITTVFKAGGWPGWEGLEPGDIIAKDDHVEIFARNEGNNHYVWNCGGNSSVNNPDATITGHGSGYRTVWRIGEACAGGISSYDVSGGSYSGSTAISGSSSSSSSDGGFLSKLSSWASTLANKTVGYLTGSMSLGEATDWSGWLNGSNGSSTSTATSTSSGYTGSSGASSANLSASDLQKTVWKKLRKDGPYTAEGSAGVMGNLFAESGVRPNNVQDSCESRVGSDDVYTAKVDDGSYTIDQFSGDSAGYGLAQWTSSERKRGLYSLAKSKGVSIADPDMQAEHLLNELKSSYKSIHDMLTTTTDVGEASYRVMHDFEAPAAKDSESTKKTRESYAISMLDNYKDLPIDGTGSSGGSAMANASTSSQATASALGGSGGGKGDSTPAAPKWKYNTDVSATPTKGSSNPRGETVRGSSAPINISEHVEFKSRQNGGRGISDETATKLLEQIVQILTSSNTKLDNLSYLSDIGSGGSTTNNNNFTTINSVGTGSSTSNRNLRNTEVEKWSSAAYEDAKRISAG